MLISACAGSDVDIDEYERLLEENEQMRSMLGENPELETIVRTVVTNNNDNSLIGTWQGRTYLDENGNEYTETMVFTENTFTFTSYTRTQTIHVIEEPPQSDVYVEHQRLREWLFDGRSLKIDFFTEYEHSAAVVIHSYFSDEYEHYGGVYRAEIDVFQIVSTGTYSASGMQIEFVLSDNTVISEIFRFIDNKLEIGVQGRISFTRE